MAFVAIFTPRKWATSTWNRDGASAWRKLRCLLEVVCLWDERRMVPKQRLTSTAKYSFPVSPETSLRCESILRGALYSRRYASPSPKAPISKFIKKPPNYCSFVMLFQGTPKAVDRQEMQHFWIWLNWLFHQITHQDSKYMHKVRFDSQSIVKFCGCRYWLPCFTKILLSFLCSSPSVNLSLFCSNLAWLLVRSLPWSQMWLWTLASKEFSRYCSNCCFLIQLSSTFIQSHTHIQDDYSTQILKFIMQIVTRGHSL